MMNIDILPRVCTPRKFLFFLLFFNMKHGLGRDALGAVLLNKCHPARELATQFPNETGNGSRTKLEGCRVLRIEKKVINSRETDAVVFYYDRLEEGFEAYCCTRWFIVTTACPTTNETTNDEAQEEAQEEGVDENDLHLITRDNITADDRDLVNSGIEVHDDNLPAPENVPRAQDRNLNSIWETGWRDSCICPRRTAGAGHRSARLLRHHRDLKLSRLQVFEIMFPTTWVKNCLIPETNKYLKFTLS